MVKCLPTFVSDSPVTTSLYPPLMDEVASLTTLPPGVPSTGTLKTILKTVHRHIIYNFILLQTPYLKTILDDYFIYFYMKNIKADKMV